MKIVFISDTHGKHKRLELPSADLLIHSGDFSNRNEESVIEFNNWLGTIKDKFSNIVVVAGNHDFLFEEKPKLAKSLLTNAIYLEDSGTKINGLNLWGSPVSPRFFNWAFNRNRGKHISKHWDLIPSEIDLLITHSPPFGILDKTLTGQHVGCEDLLKTIERIKPKISAFGHIHESYGIIEKEGIKFINSSSVNIFYRHVNKPIVVEL